MRDFYDIHSAIAECKICGAWFPVTPLGAGQPRTCDMCEGKRVMQRVLDNFNKKRIRTSQRTLDMCKKYRVKRKLSVK